MKPRVRKMRSVKSDPTRTRQARERAKAEHLAQLVKASSPAPACIDCQFDQHDPGSEALSLCPCTPRDCGHHCEHSWPPDNRCCWCGQEFGMVRVENWLAPVPERLIGRKRESP